MIQESLMLSAHLELAKQFYVKKLISKLISFWSEVQKFFLDLIIKTIKASQNINAFIQKPEQKQRRPNYPTENIWP